MGTGRPMPDILERNIRKFSWGYWIAVAIGVAAAIAYAAGICAIDSFC